MLVTDHASPVDGNLILMNESMKTKLYIDRLAFAAAREGHLVDVLSYVDMRRYTPSPALVFNAFLSSKTIQFLHKFL